MNCHQNRQIQYRKIFQKIFEFLNQLFIVISGVVELNPRHLTIYKFRIQNFTGKSTHVRISHTNCKILLKKKHVLQYMVNNRGANTIIVFSETKLKDNDDGKLRQLNVKLFKVFRCERKSNEKQQGGGVMIVN